MKRKSIIALFLGCIGLGSITTSCEDILSSDSERHSYVVAQDTLYSYWGILRSLQNVGERYVVLGECRGDLVSGTSYLSDSISAILNFNMDQAVDGSCRYLQASDYYHIINSCNAYMANCDTLRLTGTLKPYMMKEYAQVSAIRAWVYLQLIQVYGEVPFYTTPLLTTDEINHFMSNPSHQKATADNLVDLLAPELERMYAVEQEYGFPQYSSYGKTNIVCHSEKAMIPVSLILGDLYLTKGDKESCKKACQWYYNYFSPKNNSKAGGPLPTDYFSYAFKGEGMDKPDYDYMGTPWTEKDAWDQNYESITAIPSSTNKLWGVVQRGVNELFGFTSVISVSGDTAVSSSVRLTPKYDAKQLKASTGYFDQCKAVPFESYIAPDYNALSGSDNSIFVDTVVGDARQSWVREYTITYANGEHKNEYFVTKQNPGGSYTTVYPMIYRKSMVWLRFAEALNRADYPGFAFAILKNGLCNNDSWLPDAETDYAIKDTLYTEAIVNFTMMDKTVRRDTLRPEEEINHYVDMVALMEQHIAEVESTEEVKETSTPIYYYAAKTLQNYVDESSTSSIICDYISLRERLNSMEEPFLNMNTESLYSPFTSTYVMHRISENSPSITIQTYSTTTSGSYITTGVHYRGGGLLKYDEKRSIFNYVDKIAEIAKKNYGLTLTKDDIYNEENLELVKDCVEDLIVNEEAMELAFEGTRFFDLMRVAHRRGDAKYLAERVSKRNGEKDAALYGKLLNTRNWYFPLPQK